MTTTTTTRAAEQVIPQATVARRRWRRSAGVLAQWIFGIFVSSIILIPLLYGFFDGFKTNGEIVGEAASLLPKNWDTSSYATVLDFATSPFWTELVNSVLVAAVTVGVLVTFAALAAYVLARITFPGREAVYTLFTLGLLFPAAVAILPLLLTLKMLGLTENPLGVALPQAAFGLPLTIIILRPFFRSISTEIEDAAKIDGCSTFGFFWRIMLPLSRPALATVTILALVGSWNNFLLPLVVFGAPDQWTLPLGVMNFSSDHTSAWNLILAFTTISMAPAIIFYALAERQIVSGLTAGSVRG